MLERPSHRTGTIRSQHGLVENYAQPQSSLGAVEATTFPQAGGPPREQQCPRIPSRPGITETCANLPTAQVSRSCDRPLYRRSLAGNAYAGAIGPRDRSLRELGATAQPASGAKEALAIAADPVAARYSSGPAACLVPTVHDPALSYFTVVHVLVAAAAKAAVGLVDAVEVAVGARRSTLRGVVGLLGACAARKRFSARQVARSQGSHAHERGLASTL